MDLKIAVIVILGILPSICDGACSFPSHLKNGTWQSNDMGDFTFNETHFTASRVASFGSRTFTCLTQSGNQYYSLSDTFSLFTSKFKVSVCFTLQAETETKYYYHLHTPILPNTDYSRIFFEVSNHTFTQAEACSVQGTSFSQVRVLIRQGYANTSSIACENNLLSQFTYNISGVTCSKSFMDSCVNNNELVFNYSYCSYPMAYSTGGVLRCMYSSSSGATTYSILYNMDSTVDYSTTYRYTCVATSTSDNVTYVTSYPGMCLDGQNTTGIKSPGVTFSMMSNVNETCSVPSEKDSSAVFSAGAIFAVIFAVVLLIVAGGLMAIFYVVKVRKFKKVKPDSEGLIPSKSPPIGTREEKKADGRVSPFTPLPTVSEIALYRWGQEIDDDDGGMTLEATTPGFTDGRRTLFDKDVDRESQVSLPVYSEPGGETPDPTRLSEVQTRMSEISEQNLADPAPWTMTRATMNIPEESSVSPIQSPTGNKPNGTAKSLNLT